MSKVDIKRYIRESYGSIARSDGGEGCGCGCGADNAGDLARSIGYTDEELKGIPDGANMGLGCGNPTALAGLKEGETVLDLGSGGGFDCFVAAPRVGPQGKVIGVDMTPDMVEKARANAARHGVDNVEFRLGEIENLPVADNSVDVVISNCVLNLSQDKEQVFSEIARVLKPGGRVAISDIALLKKLPVEWQASLEAHAGCISGAVLIDEYRRIVESSGLREIEMQIHETGCDLDSPSEDPLGEAIRSNQEQYGSLKGFVTSVNVEAVK